MAGLFAGIAIAGLAISVTTTAMSFAEAAKQKKMQKEYENDADKALAEAREALKVNYAKKMSIKKDSYNKERLAAISTSQQFIEAVSESDRGAAGGGGQVLMSQQAVQSDITDRETDELTDIENAILEEDSRLRDINVDINMQEIEGQQRAAADAKNAAAQNTQQGIEGIAQSAQQGLDLVSLYGQNKKAQQQALSGVQFNEGDFQNFGNVLGENGGPSKSMGAAGSPGFTNLDFEKIGAMNPIEYRQFLKELTPTQRQMLFYNKQYTDRLSN
jgi:hypothetical protein